MKFLPRLSFVLFFLSSSTLSAQESFEMTPSRGMIELSFAKVPQRTLESLPGSFASEGGGINGVVPIYRSMEKTEHGVSLSQWALSGAVRRTTIDIPSLTPGRVLTAASIGASWILLNGASEVYAVSGTAGVAEDKLITGSPELRFRLTALGTYRASDPLLLIYGANYSALFGRDRLLPVLGVKWTMSSDWSGAVILPFSLSVRYKATRDVMLKLAAGATGDRMRVANHNDYPQESNVLQMRSSGAKVSMTFTGKISNDFRMDVEAGMLAARRLELTSDERTLVDTRVKSTGYITVGFRFYFSMSNDVDEMF